jgi:hypothetical protein
MLLRILHFTFILILIFTLGACSFEEQRSRNDMNNSVIDITSIPIEPEIQPPYIVKTWPEPGQSVTIEDYKTLLWFDATEPGICVVFDPFALVEKGEFLSTEDYLTRFRLEVDDITIDELHYVFLPDTEGYDGPPDPETGEPMYHVPDGWPYYLCFSVHLNEGRHNATVIGRRTSGDEILYSWWFVLVKE